MKKFIITLICLTLSGLLSSCVSHPSAKYPSHPKTLQNHEVGRVSNIEMLTVESRPSGQDNVRVAISGGQPSLVAQAVANSQNTRTGNDSEIYRITVRLESGRSQEFDYIDISGLRVGDRVKVEADQLFRF